jgi:hypothetical protein
MRYAAFALAGLLMGGCLSLPANPENMTPEQIKEWVKDKSMAATCTTLNTPYGRGIVVHVGIDKSVVPNGAVQVDDQCKVTFTNAPVPRLAP